MSVMDRSRWLRASGHLDRVLELPPEAREACLAALREEDPESAADVAALLDEHRRLTAEGFLDSAPPIAAGGAARRRHDSAPTRSSRASARAAWAPCGWRRAATAASRARRR